MIVKLGSGPRY